MEDITKEDNQNYSTFMRDIGAKKTLSSDKPGKFYVSNF